MVAVQRRGPHGHALGPRWPRELHAGQPRGPQALTRLPADLAGQEGQRRSAAQGIEERRQTGLPILGQQRVERLPEHRRALQRHLALDQLEERRWATLLVAGHLRHVHDEQAPAQVPADRLRHALLAGAVGAAQVNDRGTVGGAVLHEADELSPGRVVDRPSIRARLGIEEADTRSDPLVDRVGVQEIPDDPGVDRDVLGEQRGMRLGRVLEERQQMVAEQ